MHVCFVNLWHPPDVVDAADLVARDTPRRGFAEALVRRGLQVTVVQEAPWSAETMRAGVRWILVPPSPLTVRSRRALALAGVRNPRVRAPADAPVPVVAALQPDVVHSFDLCFYPSLLLLGRATTRLGVPLFAHFHGGAPARRRGWRVVERAALAHVRGAFFTTRVQAAGFPLPPERVFEVFETSTFVEPGPRPPPGARFLHLGRLDPVKDPLTTLDGFARIARVRPDARLVMAWNEGPLEREIRRRVAADPLLGDRVTLRGHVPHGELPALFGAADVLLQASLREVCGVAVLEALASDVPPVVSDIPAFRALTEGGRQGGLFPVGDPAGLAAAALDVLERRPSPRAWFERALSFDALAARLEAAYRQAS